MDNKKKIGRYAAKYSVEFPQLKPSKSLHQLKLSKFRLQKDPRANPRRYVSLLKIRYSFPELSVPAKEGNNLFVMKPVHMHKPLPRLGKIPVIVNYSRHHSKKIEHKPDEKSDASTPRPWTRKSSELNL